MPAAYPFEYFLIFLVTKYKEDTYIIRELARRFPFIFSTPRPVSGFQLRSQEIAWNSVRAGRKEAVLQEIVRLREEYKHLLSSDAVLADLYGVRSAFSGTAEFVGAHALLSKPERFTVELCLLANIFLTDVRSIVLSKHNEDIHETVLAEFGHYFFNARRLMRAEFYRYVSLMEEDERIIYTDVYFGGKEAVCLHLNIDDEELDFGADLRSLYRLAFNQLMRLRDQPAESGRLATYWLRVFTESYDRLRAGDDGINRMLKAMEHFALGRQDQAFEIMDSIKGEILH